MVAFLCSNCLFTSVCDHLPSIEVKGSCNLQELVCLSGELFLVDGLLLIGIAAIDSTPQMLFLNIVNWIGCP